MFDWPTTIHDIIQTCFSWMPLLLVSDSIAQKAIATTPSECWIFTLAVILMVKIIVQNTSLSLDTYNYFFLLILTVLYSDFESTCLLWFGTSGHMYALIMWCIVRTWIRRRYSQKEENEDLHIQGFYLSQCYLCCFTSTRRTHILTHGLHLYWMCFVFQKICLYRGMCEKIISKSNNISHISIVLLMRYIHALFRCSTMTLS